MTDSVRSTSSLTAFKEAYFNPQALAMLFLGFAAGVPILLIFSSLGLWLREAGIDRSTVTMFSWAALGYSFKFIWSPLVDVLPVPVLNKWLGQRRAWLLLTQMGIIGAIVLMASVDPAQSRLSIMALGAVLLGFSAATQDIVIDAYRIESAPSQMQTALSATYVGGYRIGMIVSGAGALYLADFFGSNEAAYSYAAWQKTYLIMAAVMLIAVTTTLFIREPKYAVKKEHMNSTSDNLRLLVVFAVSVIGFIFAYVQVGGVLPETDSVGLGFLYGVVRFISSGIVMGIIGYALVQIGLVAKSVAARAWVMPIRDFFERYGKKALLVLALIGLYLIPAIAQKTGVMRAMMIGALLACATNLLFILLFYTPTSFMMYMAVITDNLAAGLASAVFIAFLSALTSIRFTAVQYALFSSLMTLSPKILGGYSGAIVDATNYPVFFAITFVIGIPILLLVYLVNKHITIEEPAIKK